MRSLPEPVLAALRAQLQIRAGMLQAGARRVGWKVAASIPGVEDHLGSGGRVFGYLTSATELMPGQEGPPGRTAQLCAETELAIKLEHALAAGADREAAAAAIGGLGVALELVDVGAGSSMHEVIAGNVYHQAVAFHFPSPAVRSVPSPLSAWLTIGQTSFHTESDVDVAAVVVEMANMLGSVGEQLQAGDRIIAGSLLHQPITANRSAAAGIAGLGDVSCRTAP